MNKDRITGILVGAAITALILWKWHVAKVSVIENSYNEQLALLDSSGSDSAKKNVEFAEIGSECELIKQFKMSLNYLGGAAYFDDLPVLSPQDNDRLMPILKNTTHFTNENNGLRKSFLYDFNKSVANVLEADDFPLRSFKYEYTGGVLSKGDKGSDVNKMQQLLNLLHKEENPNPVNGTYDKDTYSIVSKTFNGTTALIDENAGTISREFIDNFSIIVTNLIYQYVDNTTLEKEF